MARTTSKEQYVPCKDGNCKVSAEFKAIGDPTSCFKGDLISLSLSNSFKRNDMLKNKLKENIEERLCPDALSATTLGEWRNDGLLIPPLKMQGDGSGIKALQKCDRHVPKIILILESPHIAEYATRECEHFGDCCLYATPAPVRGKTGEKVKSMLPQMFDKRFDDYSVAFINIVQYQCSLGMPLKDDYLSMKNEIVWTLFNRAYKSNFVERFRNAYCPDHDIVIICPTGGEKCRQKVYKTLRDNFDDLRCVLTTGHPSSWTLNCANRAISVFECTNMTEESISDITFCKANAHQLYDALSGRMNNDLPVNGVILFKGETYAGHDKLLSAFSRRRKEDYMRL